MSKKTRPEKANPTKKPINAAVEYIHNGLSLADIAIKYKGKRGYTLRCLERKSSKQGWVEKRRAYVGKVAVETERRTIGTVAEMNARHIERAIKIQEVAYKQLESGLSDNPVSAYRLALDSERLARGEVTDRTGDEIPPSLEDVDKDSLREIGNIVARARAKRAKEPGL